MAHILCSSGFQLTNSEQHFNSIQCLDSMDLSHLICPPHRTGHTEQVWILSFLTGEV